MSEDLREKLFDKKENGWKKVNDEEKKKIFEYSKGFVHSKQVICDDVLAVVGTINFDYRSLLHHYECATLMYKTDCIKDIKQDFNRLFAVSIDMKDFKQNPFVRLMCALMKIFTPML